MKLLYLHQFFAGPDSPGPAQPRNLVKRLGERGHQVTVLACNLNAYNEQEEPEECIEFESSGGKVDVVRLPVPGNLRGGLGNRLKTYASFAWKAWRSAKSLPKPDAVMVSIQPLFSGLAAKKLANHWKVPWLLELRDLWPDALVVKKAIAPWQGHVLEKLARNLYFSADRVVSLTPGIKSELLEKGVCSARLDVFPNGYQPRNFMLPDDTRNSIRQKYGWEDSVVAVYTGAHTEVTAVDVIVRAAEFIRQRNDIRLDLFGAGHSKPAAIELARKLNLSNVHFHDAVPKSEIPSILAGADLGIMTLFHSPLIHIYFENKFIDYTGAALPIAGAMGGVQADIIVREKAGVVASGLDAEGLSEAIRFLADHPNERTRMGLAGRQFISTFLDQDAILDRYAETLEYLAAGTGAELTVWDPFQVVDAPI